MESHDQFKNRVLGAPKDVSLPILEGLLGQGYDNTRWRTSAGATDGPCLAKNGDEEPLSDFVSGLMYDAPFFEKTHVGCKCGVEVTGPALPDVFVTAFGQE
jgi:hypothetical protein